jgi:acetyl esterase
MPIHPEAQQLLDALRDAGMPPFEAMTVPQAREATKGFLDLQGEPEEIAVENRTIPGPEGDIPVRIYTPDGSAERPVIVYFHGGGWVIGELDTVDRPVRSIALRTGSVVVSVDYRLAPEHVYPAAFDDCYAATVWVAEHAAELGADPARVAVGGDSAGGNLATIVAQERRDAPPALQLLIYPSVDVSTPRPSHELFAEGFFLTAALIDWYAGHFLPEGSDPTDVRRSPLLAPDLSGVAPALVVTAGFDPLRDEGEAYAQRLREAGVTVLAHRFRGLFHGFINSVGVSPACYAALTEVAGMTRALFATL